MRLLLWVGALFTMGSALSSAFVNVFLWKQTRNLGTLGIYNGLQYLVMPLVFYLSSRFHRGQRETFLRIGIFLHAMFYALVLWIGQRANPYWMGVLLGSGAGLYWYGYNLLSLHVTNMEARGEYNSWSGVFWSLAAMLAPLISGFMILQLKNAGYTAVFSLSLVFFAGSFLVSQRLQTESEIVTPAPVFHRQHPNWNRVLISHFFQGMREGVFVFFAAIMVMITTGSEWGLGKYTSITALLSTLSFFAVGKILKWQWYNESMLIGSFISTGAIALFLFDQSYRSLLGYGIITALFTPLFAVPFGARSFHVIDEAHERYEREYIVEREVVLNGGRVASIVSFLAAYQLFVKEWIPFYLLIVGSMQILAVLVLRTVGFRLKRIGEEDA
jgi:YQGE family putative transporter